MSLEKFEKRIYSQNGEDGIIEYIFQHISPLHKFAVEFGAYDGIINSNVYNLVENHGWKTLQMDINIPKTKNSNIIVHKEFITPDNINTTLGM